ncbi:hypothetical protein B0E38_07759 [Streptomyces sp. 111WW2]|uniref:nuclease-related domain-containing protein n=1 Tax=Streptomyces sp. 111WW2 TaxID=1945515 RepID=UPI000D0C96B4|nr:nuclease-related domain-containing protein [Streptomyces sp. 111WW2]PSK43954.1 hypothetical protein B0E38_07759 [Streptomyces sp. 111WW2]
MGTGTLLLLVAGVSAYWWWRTRGPGQTASPRRGGPITGAGASADARARELRTPLVRLATAVGIQTRAEALARRSETGAVGERYVAALLGPLTAEGWIFLADRCLPRGNANIDLLAISPRGQVYVLDPKKWSARRRLYISGGRLMHGKVDVSDRLRGLRYETDTVSRLLGVTALPVAVMVGPMPRGTQLRYRGIRLVPALDICKVLRGLDRQHTPNQRTRQLADTAERLLPPKTRK